MSYYKDSLKLETDRNAAVEDLLRNIAGISDGSMTLELHNVLLQAALEWRQKAREILDAGGF